MGERSEISWTDNTFNPWIGCRRVGPGCDRCYAARDNERRKWVVALNDDGTPMLDDAGKRIPVWGEIGGGPGVRHRTKTWGEPIKWNKRAAETGYRPRVFCASLADVFDNDVDDQWRVDLWALLRATPNLRWMLLTKRIGNVRKMVPDDWPFPHVGLMATIVNQEEWDRDATKLRDMAAPWRGVSVEPMIGPITMHSFLPDWIITGGESGGGCRPCDKSWVTGMRDQCREFGIAFHHKQWSSGTPGAAGCLVDGVEHKDFPLALA